MLRGFTNIAAMYGLLGALREMPAIDFGFSLKQSASSDFGVRSYRPKHNRYTPHQGKRECARRLRQPQVIRALAEAVSA
jgi:hypothetical protein